MSAIYMDMQRQVRVGHRGASLLLILHELSAVADHAGRAHISIAALARRIGCIGERQTQRLIRQLGEAGLLETVAQFAGGDHGAQLPNTYRLLTTWVRQQVEHEKAKLASHTVKVAQRVQRQAVKWFSRKVYRLADGREGCQHQFDPPCDECRRQ